MGISEAQEICIPANILVQKEIALIGSQGYCWDFQDALKLVERGDVNLNEIVTHRFPFSSLQQAFELLTDPYGEAIKVVIQM